MAFKISWFVYNRYMRLWGSGGSGHELICMWDLKGKNSPRLHIFTKHRALNCFRILKEH